GNHTHAALLLPEIILRLGTHLDRKAFLASILVCRLWHVHLIRLLWHDLVLPQKYHHLLNFSSSSNFPPTDTFKERGHLVRSLVCNSLPHHLRYLDPHCNQLTALEVTDLTEDSALPLLRLNRLSLGSVRFGRDRLDRDVRPPSTQLELLTAISDCVNLDRLWLDNIQVDGRESSKEDKRQRSVLFGSNSREPLQPFSSTTCSELFYELAHRLTQLGIVKDVIRTSPTPGNIFYRLRKLSLVDSTLTYKDQIQLITQCQYLTHLRWQLTRRKQKRIHPGYGDDHYYYFPYTYNTIEYSLLESENEGIDLSRMETCPITHLDISQSTLLDTEIAALLVHLPRLVSLIAQRTKIGRRTIEYLTTGPRSSVLQELDLTDIESGQEEQQQQQQQEEENEEGGGSPSNINSTCYIQEVLRCCSGLIRFRATSLKALDMVSSLLTSSKVEESPSWSCFGLEELYLSIIEVPSSTSSTTSSSSSYDPFATTTSSSSTSSLTSTSTSPSSSAAANQISHRRIQSAIYCVLSKLTQLRVLSLGGDSTCSTWFRTGTLELSLDSGLSKLATLSRLREFNFSYMEHKLTMVEVEWMMKHWPCLRKVTGTIAPDAQPLARGEVEEEEEKEEIEQHRRKAMTSNRKRVVDRHELYLQRHYPLVQFSTR
ncbi:hypothetical protein BG004_005411, partial [Podila humilis]